MNSIEERDNLISMLKEALKFYADNNNYFTSQEVSKQPAPSMIQLDGGSQAKFALEKVEALDRMNQKMQEDYDKLTNGLLDAVDNSADTVEMYDKINIIRTLGDKIYGDKI